MMRMVEFMRRLKTQLPQAFLGGTALWAGVLTLESPGAAAPPPFASTPLGFERWLNARHDWPHGQRLVFRDLALCDDQTAKVSPYRMPVFTCLQGQLSIREPGKVERFCSLQRVSYFPTNARVRYWTSTCRPR